MGAVAFGIAGFSYDDWKGRVYPRGCKDPLRYCAGFVDLIEINSTFYQVPNARVCASWVTRVADLETRFTAKLPARFTHEGEIDGVAAGQVREGFAPLVESGRLVTLLAQFSHRFEHRPASVDRLRWLRDEFAGVAPLTVEVRHASFGTRAALQDLRELDVSVAELDYPGAFTGTGGTIRGPGDFAYLRLHGRNEVAWFAKDAGRDEVYDHEYTVSERRGLLQRIGALRDVAVETVVVGNNHFQGKAMKVVLELLAAMRGTKVDVPEPLVAAYPSLTSIASRAQGQLF